MSYEQHSESDIAEVQTGPFSEMSGVLGANWKNRPTETQEAIASALTEITGDDNPGIVELVPPEQASLFADHLRNYMAEGSSADLKVAAADAVRRLLAAPEESGK